MSKFQAVLFDCDGVLVDSEVVGLEDAVQFLADQGLPIARDDLIRRFTGMRSDRFRGELRAELAAAWGRAIDDEEFERFFEEFVSARRANRHLMRLVEGAAAAVQAAADTMPVAVASSSAQHFLDSKIDRYGLRPLFGDHVYSADVVAHGKPAPDIFLFAAAQLGIAPEACLVVEDSPHGVTAGRAAGATVWGFTGGGHCLGDHPDRLRAAGATRILADHGELAAAFRAL